MTSFFEDGVDCVVMKNVNMTVLLNEGRVQEDLDAGMDKMERMMWWYLYVFLPGTFAC